MFELNPKSMYIHVYATSMKKGYANGSNRKQVFRMINSGSGNYVNEANNPSPTIVNLSQVAINPKCI